MSSETPYTSTEIQELSHLLNEPFLPYQILAYQSHMLGQSEMNTSHLEIHDDGSRDITDDRLEKARLRLENNRERE